MRYTFKTMKIRKAKINDVKAISSLINSYAEQDRMLFRSKADIYESLQTFCVAERESEVVGCCALEIVWSDLAEIKSLAVDTSNISRGVGKALVDFAVEQAREIGLERVFALTLEQGFFEKQGFEIIQKDTLPMKVWRDCAKCPKQQNCDEIAALKKLKA